MSELCPAGRSEGYEVYADDVEAGPMWPPASDPPYSPGRIVMHPYAHIIVHPAGAAPRAALFPSLPPLSITKAKQSKQQENYGGFHGLTSSHY